MNWRHARDDVGSGDQGIRRECVTCLWCCFVRGCDWWWIAAVSLVEANWLIVVIDSSDSSIQDCIASPFIPHRRPIGDPLPAIASSFCRILFYQQALFSTAKWSRNGYSVTIWVKVRTNEYCLRLNPAIMRKQWVYHLHLAGIASWSTTIRHDCVSI